MGAASPQIEWLERDLQTAAASCVLAFWDDPLHSSGLRNLLPWYDDRPDERPLG
jgi:hypothetical protein